MAKHNAGMAQSIQLYITFLIVYFEQLNTEAEAIVREKYFKIAAGRRFLKHVMAQ